MRQRLIIVTGWAHDQTDLLPFASKLTEAFDVTVITPDQLLDYGDSYALGLQSFAEEQIGPFSVVGHSMGGIICLDSILEFDLSPERLVLVSSTPRFCSSDNDQFGVPLKNVKAMMLGMKKNPEATLMAFHKDASFPIAVDDNILKLRTEKAMQLGVDALNKGLQYLAVKDYARDVADIDLPVLLVHGVQDKVVSPQASEYIASKIRCGRINLHDHAGHGMIVNTPEIIVDEIKEYLLDE